MELFTHLKDDNPGIGNVIKIDGTFVWVAASSMTSGVVLVPVDAQASYTDAVIGQRFRTQSNGLTVDNVLFVQTTGPASFTAGWDI